MTTIVRTLRDSFTPLRLPNLRTYLIGQAISLLGTPTVMTTVNGLLQVLAPLKMRGRLLSAYIIVSFGIQPLAALFIGLFASRLGIAGAIMIDGIAIMLGAMLLLTLRPALRSWVAPRPSDEASSDKAAASSEPA